MENKNIFTFTEEVVKDFDGKIEDVVSVSFIYRSTGKVSRKTNKPINIKGLNIQMYGHVLIIVPDVNNTKEYYQYNTSDRDSRTTIVKDLIENKGFTQVDVAKLMKCSATSIARLLG